MAAMAAMAAMAPTMGFRGFNGNGSKGKCSMGHFALRNHPDVSEVRVALNVNRQCRSGFLICHGVTEDIPQVASPGVEDVKSALSVALDGINRGIFGVTSQRKAEIEGLLMSLEALNPLPRPTEDLDKVKGEWRLLYSNISILGVKRTKLGLRDFISLGDFLQIIDIEENRAINKIAFNVAGLGMLQGALTIEASYSVTSPTRVNIELKGSSIAPDQLLSLFKKNYELLLEIFNPAGWLEITYVDDTLRVGRDNKGNVFLVERT